MKKMSVLLLIFITSSFLASLSQAQDATVSSADVLREFFFSPNCEQACWLGIEPGMTQEETEAILETNGIEYETSTSTILGVEVVSYTVTEGFTHPYISPEPYSIVISLKPNEDNLASVSSIDLTLNDVFVADIVATLGAPVYIFQSVRMTPPTRFEIYYPSLGVAFAVENATQLNYVHYASLRSGDLLLEPMRYATEFSGVYKDCQAVWDICAVPTATPDPETLPASTAMTDIALLHDLLLSPDCETACWRGISLGMPEDEMIAMLEANDLTYEVQSVSYADTVGYSITSGETNPFVAPGFQNSIVIWVDRSPEAEHPIISSIDLQLNDIPVIDLMAAFGAPTHVLEEPSYEGAVAYILYEEQGLMFTTGYDRVRSVDILSDMTGYTVMYEPLEACTTKGETCAIPTAIPASSDVSLHDLVLGPDCETDCWMGITPGMTEKDLFALLEANDVPYEVLSTTVSQGKEQISYLVGTEGGPAMGPADNLVTVWSEREEGTDDAYIVQGVELYLTGMTVEEMAADFGAPSLIFQAVDETRFLVTYLDDGIVFSVDNDDDENNIPLVYIQSRESLLIAYQDFIDLSGVFQNGCPLEWPICAVPTATPMSSLMPTATATTAGE